MLIFHDELDDIPAGMAAEAVINAAHGVHVEARGLLIVERTEGAEIRPGPLQGEISPDDLDDVIRLDHPLLGFF